MLRAPISPQVPSASGATPVYYDANGNWQWYPYATGGATRPDSFTGMQEDFRTALEWLFAEAPEDVREGLQVYSGYRSPERQAELWESALQRYGSEAEARRWVAPPGRSQHNHGTAADLRFASDDVRNYVHQNAGNYGLAFPLSNENWHIELASARGGQPAPPVMASAQPQGGQQPMQQQPGLLATMSTMNQQPPRDPSIWDALVGRLPERAQGFAGRTIGDADWRDRMAIGLAGMSMRPNEALIDTLQGRMDDRSQERRINQTVQWLQSIGRTDLAEAVAAGSLMGDQAAAIALQPQERPRPIEINGQLVDPTTGQVIGDYRTQEAPDPGFRTLSPEEAQAAGLPTNSIWQVGPDGRYTQVSGSQIDPAAVADPTDLRKEWNALPQIRDFADRASAYRNVVASVQNPSAAGDISLVFNYMKMLDPGSTVREGEAATMQQAGSLPQSLIAQYNSLVNGETFTPELRADFLSRASDLYRTQEQQYLQIRGQYENTALTAGVDPDATLTDYRFVPQGQVPFVRERPKGRPDAAAPPASQTASPSGSAVQIPLAVLENETFKSLAASHGKTPEEYFQSLPENIRAQFIERYQ
jgi:hypothetical protein